MPFKRPAIEVSGYRGRRVFAGRRGRRFYVYSEWFKEARLIGAMTVQQAAVCVGVTLRTIKNWESGRTRVPYSAFKLLRISTGYALPGEAWRGWCIRGDTLWSPEEKPFRASDFNWWGLTVAMARAWRQRYGIGAAADQVVAQVSFTVADVDRMASFSPVDSPASADVATVAGSQPQCIESLQSHDMKYREAVDGRAQRAHQRPPV